MYWRVEESLLDQLTPLLASPGHGEKWIRRLGQTESSQRLGISIAIDIRSGAVASETYAQIIGFINAQVADPTVSFAKSIGIFRDHKNLTAVAAPCDGSRDIVRYARLLELDTFIRYFLTPNYGYTAADRREVREVFLREPLAPIDDLGPVWEETNRATWVVDFKELECFLSSSQTSGMATDICNHYGIPIHRPTELIFVLYPENLEGLTAVKPTALDNWHFSGESYVSSVEPDGWGRSVVLSGDGVGFRERVHRPLKFLPESFSISYIGEARPVVRNSERILQEAYHRLERVF